MKKNMKIVKKRSERMMKPPPSLFPTSLLQKGRVSPYMIFTSLFVVFILFITIIYGENFRFSRFYSPNYPYSGQDQTLSSTTNQKLPPFAIGETEKGCDVFSGTWVWDDVGHPLYEESECPYIQPQLTCQEHGRPDKDYRHWRWQPHACSLPSFNSTLMLETLRDKRMMFVGDSLSRGQYVSMVCLLNKLIPDHENAKSMQTLGSLSVFTAEEYNATIEFYWAPFLLESNSDNQNFLTSNKRFVRRGSINKHGDNWKGVDIIVFSTYEWWITTGPNINVFKQGSLGNVEKDMETLSTEDAYSMTMQDMLGWVKENMDPNKTRVFFTSMSPSHKKSVDWGGDSKGNCYNETTMIQDPNYWGSESSKSVMRLIESVFGKSTVPITFLNITQLSSYRKDGHTSIYKKQWGPLTNEQLADPASYADCLHWCLPGVHDTWNELLFAKLFYP